MNQSEKVSPIVRLLDGYLWLARYKQRLDVVAYQTSAFEDEFAVEYAKLLRELESQLFGTEDSLEEEQYKRAFVAAATALMLKLLKKRGTRAARAGWREEVSDIELEALLRTLEGDWEAASLEGLMPRLQRAGSYQGEGEVISRLAAVGSYGLLFGGIVWSAFWGARVESGSEDALYRWDGTLDPMTCETCVDRIGNVYRASRLPGWPGDRSTICNGNCRCWLFELSAMEAAGVLETMKQYVTENHHA